jgi:hypothetical protein
MPDRSLFSRILRAAGRLLRRITIGLGALIFIVYFLGDWIYARPYPASSEWPKSSVRNSRGDAAEISVHGCIFGFFTREYRVRVRPGDGSSAKLVVRFKPQESPVLYWRDDEHLLVDLGQVTSLSPQIHQAGPVRITFTSSGANPSLD